MDTFSNIPGGWGGIRTPGGVAPTTVFKTVAIDRSATHPKLFSRRSFKPAVLFAVRTWRCCSPLVRARLRYTCLADSYARPSQSTAASTHPKLFSRRSFKPAVLFAVRTWARVTWHILHKFFTNAIAKYFVTAFYMPMRFLYDTVILYPYIHAYNRPK